MADTLCIVLPCYNEEEVLPLTIPAMQEKLRALIGEGLVSPKSRVLMVNDCSTDRTWELIREAAENDSLFTGISLAHNSGEQNANLAGMEAAISFADVVITTDADLQDGTDAIDEMLREYSKGSEIVYGVRRSRGNEPLMTRLTSGAFYRLIDFCGIEFVREHSQYRLMSKRAVEALLDRGGSDVFLPAEVPLLGFKHSVVCHDRKPREAGSSHYNFKSLFRMAVGAVTSYSSAPIRLIGLMSLASFLLSVAGFICSLVKVCRGGFPSTALVLSCVFLVAAMLLFALRILGEYIYASGLNSKNRPRYIVEESLLNDE